MSDLDTMLQDFASFIEEELPPPDVGRVLSAAAVPPAMPRRWLRPVSVAAASAMIVLLVVGGPVVAWMLWGESGPVTEEMTPTTTVVPSTVPSDIESLIGPATIVGWGRVPHDDAVFGTDGDSVAVHDVTRDGSGFVAVGHWNNSAAVWVSTDGSSWSRVPHDPDVFGDAVGSRVVAGGPGLVAVGGSGPTIWRSQDGVSWMRLDLIEAGFEDAGSLHALTMGETRLVAGGIKCAAACGVAFWVSQNGTDWQEATVDEAAEGTNVRQLVPHGSGFVAVGSASGAGVRDAAVWVSDDGSQWTRVGVGDDAFAAASIETVAPDGDGLLGFGSDHSFGEDGHLVQWTSPDGVTWIRVALESGVFEMASVSRVVPSGEGFAAVGRDRQGPALWLSPNGMNWERQAVTDSVRGLIESVAANGPSLIAVGQQPPNTETVVGAIWVLPSEASPPPETPTTPPPGPSAIESGWTRIDIDAALIADGRLHDVAPSDQGLLALGISREPDGTRSRLVLTSMDGLAWEIAASLPEQPVPASIVEGGPGLVIGGSEDSEDVSDAAFWYSTDGSTWTRVPHDPDVFGEAQVYQVTATENQIFAHGEDWRDETFGAVIWSSTDGQAWTRTARPTWELLTVESIDGRFVAIGWEHSDDVSTEVAFWVSDDGDEWTQTHSEGAGNEFVDFHATGRRGSELMRVQGAAGSGSMTVWTSPDGYAWTRHTAAIADVGRIRAIAGTESRWVAVGRDTDDLPTVWSSTDGIDWTRVPDDGTIFGQGIGIIDILAHDSGLVAIGSITDDGIEHPASWIWTP